MTTTETIVAVATPAGRGGIGIVRVSGPGCRQIAQTITGCLPKPRHACYTDFRDRRGTLIDRGIALFFPAPHSYTGEDVLELQGHGGDVVSRMLQAAVLDCGARPARAGEFTERAFHNNRIDLLQAEAVADLIDSQSAAAARSALRSLQGDFSRAVDDLWRALVDLRVKVEGALDFPDEDVDIILGGDLSRLLDELLLQLSAIIAQAKQGRLLGSGVDIVIIGAPNVGKSSLINRLARRDAAIVTDIPGTTRDPIRESCLLGELPVVLTDTAGLQDSSDPIEQEGIRRAHLALQQADLVLWMDTDAIIDASTLHKLRDAMAAGAGLIRVHNKIDQQSLSPYKKSAAGEVDIIGLSALTGEGVDELVASIKLRLGFNDSGESVWSARERHLHALDESRTALQQASQETRGNGTLEVVAEHLRQSQDALAVLTGEFNADDLLGEIFSRFCIGK